ncbi:UNVERIFIED_CONTAM: Adenine phosphoribosyltransferase 1, chloroplastic [Sesamum calycinum]|uniref:adenine phosphoribosyltransferase n=1 Tax=Sesamum calycinum TaxID=2727403 RepID=A0AAW2JPW7_9LAMI
MSEMFNLISYLVNVGVEARGFIFGPPIALAIGAKFVPLRKPKKLPGKVFRQEYDLEYGSDCLEMHVGAVAPGERALVVDDLIATGGTLCAAMDLLDVDRKKGYYFDGFYFEMAGNDMCLPRFLRSHLEKL